MKKQYQEIFNHRGDAYHKAMELCPDARKSEFTIPLELLALSEGDILCDFPSGGGYINRFLPPSLKSVKIITFEASEEFAAKHQHCQLAEWKALPLKDESVDAVITLAALHHSQQRNSFYREAYRVLKPGGKFLIGDVEHGSLQDEFLNGFVNQHNSMGHDGDFLQAEIEATRMSSAGFEVIHNLRHDYTWNFPNKKNMIDFCTGLFGLDQASPITTYEGLSSLLNQQNALQINWGLLFIMGQKKPMK